MIRFVRNNFRQQSSRSALIALALLLCAGVLGCTVEPPRSGASVRADRQNQCGVSFDQAAYRLPETGGSVASEWTATDYDGSPSSRSVNWLMILPDGSQTGDVEPPHRVTQPGIYSIRHLCLFPYPVDRPHYYGATTTVHEP